MVETSIGSTCGVRVALVADLHAGLYVRQDQLEQLVRRLNALDVDAVLVAGDWTYEPSHDLHRSSRRSRCCAIRPMPCSATTTSRCPGAPLKAELVSALQALGVLLIEGRRVPLGRCELAGLGDLDAGAAARDLAILKKTRWSQPPARRVLLTHEPNTLYDIEPNGAALMLAGHTHGGQIDLPWFTDALLRHISRSGYKRGLYTPGTLQVFVASGTGMGKLPLRFRMPPTIDVLVL